MNRGEATSHRPPPSIAPPLTRSRDGQHGPRDLVAGDLVAEQVPDSQAVLAEVVEVVSIDFTRKIALRQRDESAIVVDVTSVVPNVMVWFEVINHSDVDLVLDRIVLELRVGQPILHGVMAHRYPVPPHETVSMITFFGMLTEGAVKLIQQQQQTQTHQTIHVTARAYFDAPAAALRFAIEGKNLFRPLTGP
jgi:hypothetical protein